MPAMAASTSEPAATSAATAPQSREKLTELSTAAALQYSLKNYTNASDLYGQALEIQAELNGDMAPENAELLFAYGRTLYKLAVAKSDVLGGRVAQEDKKKPKAGRKAKADPGEGSSAQAGANGAKQEEPNEETVASKPYFQLTGDENFTDSEDEEDEEGQGEEEQDDFGDAYEILDLARVLYTKQLESPKAEGSADKGKGKSEETPESKHIKERLADIYNYLAEISLENERFDDAVSDSRSALDLTLEVYPFEHQYVAEAYFKISLALEFASVTQIREATEGEKTQEAEVDMAKRKEAAEHMERAIASLEARLRKEEANLQTAPDDKKKEKEAQVTDVNDMLEEMRQRLVDLQADPTKQAFDPMQGIDPSVMSGLLGSIIGADPAAQKAKLEEATKTANDVTGLVRTKKKEKAPAAASSSATGSGSGKRKLEVEGDGMNGKRAKTEEMQ
ncbi:hypothetical protein BCR34DRAFT_539822 [Clohesyomyces aquaticus]|uniref:Tetratricopeptide SHNi-TPR domain-containing protein n=1 Tax=Clohesyomyces aquaticus TaxID=1231657 RepID=A0A1Y1ZK04_9PLEO|nr:hypothetical protein BCR34DRAFT_539822 [Clohesyomyces aquaticus]